MVPLRRLDADVLVIGSGIAGLRAAMAASGHGATVTVLAKGPMASSGVIGFNAPVGGEDTAEIFFEDTYRSGMMIADPGLVRLLAEHSAQAVAELEALGVTFARRGASYHLLRPLGCTHPRLVHHQNCTGAHSLRLMRRSLINRGVEIRTGVCVLELLKNGGTVAGVLAADVDSQGLMLIRAGAVVLATGGGGGLYAGSTYPARLVGDGYALALKAGAELIDMEFVQFEPCHCINPRRIGLSTTLLSHGGELRNRWNQRFVLKAYPGGEGDAPKDALARLVALEIKAGRGLTHGGVGLDLRPVPAAVIRRDHRAYYRRFLQNGIDLTKDRIEVAPAPHTFLGGVAINERCESSVAGLFAAGEVTGGVHGANRVGGNAGAECYVLGAIAGNNAAGYGKGRRVRLRRNVETDAEQMAAGFSSARASESWHALATEVRETMAANVGVLRDEASLRRALAELRRIERTTAKVAVHSLADVVARAEVSNMNLTGMLVAEGARRRKESRGVHYRIDYPERNDARWRKSIGFLFRRGRLAVTMRKRGEGRT